MLQNEMSIVFNEDEPLHVQVREQIRRQAVEGQLVDENGRLKTETELAEHFHVSRVTIRNALAPLVQEGMFDRTRGRGTFLNPNPSEQWMGRLMGFQEIISDAGYKPGARIQLYGMTSDHDEGVRTALQERAVWQLRRIRYADDKAIAVEHAYYPPDIGLALEKRDLISIKMYRVFEEELGLTIKQGTQTISAKLSSQDEDAELELSEPTALVSMERLTIDSEDRPIELLRSIYRPDIFRFTINLTRRLY
ncbi:MAG: GntR family transcriptional regulator [Pseudomonadota bacterium]